MIDKTIGIIGCGNMGEALVGRLSLLVGKSATIMVSEADPARRDCIQAKYRISIAPDNRYLVKHSDVVILAVKPQDLDALLKDALCRDAAEKKLFISIAAGITTAHIETLLGADVPVIRVMPNMPAVIGEGVSALAAGSAVRAAHMDLAREIFAAIGESVEVKEELMDAVTAVSGSGPAYFFYLMELMIAAAGGLGLDAATARRLVVKTALGSAKLLEALHEEPAALRKKVMSKGGTTEAAFRVLEAKGMAAAVAEALGAACARSRELSQR